MSNFPILQRKVFFNLIDTISALVRVSLRNTSSGPGMHHAQQQGEVEKSTVKHGQPKNNLQRSECTAPWRLEGTPLAWGLPQKPTPFCTVSLLHSDPGRARCYFGSRACCCWCLFSILQWLLSTRHQERLFALPLVDVDLCFVGLRWKV